MECEITISPCLPRNCPTTEDKAVSSVTITCPLPQYTTYVSGGTCDSATKSVKWTIPSVISGGSGTLVFSVRVEWAPVY